MSLFTPEFGVVFWMLVVFLILFGILAKYAWPAIVRMLDERADFIDKGVVYAQEAKEDREKAQADVKTLLAEAHKQQLDVLQQTERLKREMIADARKAAENEAQRVREAANLSIEQAKREAERQLRVQVASLSLQIAEKVMRKDLSSDKAQMEIIGKLLDELENKE